MDPNPAKTLDNTGYLEQSGHVSICIISLLAKTSELGSMETYEEYNAKNPFDLR